MGKSFLKEKVCFLFSLALVLMCRAAEREYFPQSRNLTWDEARKHCQVCFKDLVTLTPENTQTIVKNLTSENWVGLRKNFSSTNNQTMSWSRWANGDPLSFQNWYPGWPVLKSSYPNCCCCSCTCPEWTASTTVTGFTTANVTSSSGLIGNTTENVTDVTRFRESSTENVTDVTGFRESSTENMTDVTGYRESSTESVTDVTGYRESSTESVTDVTGYRESSTENVTDVTGYRKSSTENVTDVTGYRESSTENVTDVTGYRESSTENVTDVTEYRESSTESVTSPSGWSDAPVSVTAAPMTTSLPSVAPVCVPSPMASLGVPDTDRNYIEDSCVAMLSFGAWVEKNCLELLPFICYEDRFIGQANVTNVTSVSADLSWLPGPGNISHYRLEVNGEWQVTANVTDLTYQFVNLTAGTRYSVRVFPVKCERDLNPQEVAFYTKPYKVKNLIVTEVTETSVFLSWNKPDGNVDFYLIEVQGRQIQSDTESLEVDRLIPGSPYTFTILSGVKDRSTWSEEANITVYTKPGRVSDLRVSENTNNSLLLNWVPPEGNFTGFNVMAMNNSNGELFNAAANQTEMRVTGLPMGTQITLSVTALANDTLEGENVTVISYTVPGPVSNLTLVTTHNTLNATWNSLDSNYSSFTVKLRLDGKDVETRDNLTEHWKHFDGLLAAAKYTVVVYIVTGHLQGPPVESSKFTMLLPPTDASVSSFDSQQITFQWLAPVDTAAVTYFVNISSSFWGSHHNDTMVNKTNHTFHGLKSGTKYEFEVRTEADGKLSDPASVSHFTAAEKTEISLSMLCSSAVTLLCDNSTTRESVFNQLHAHFKRLLDDNVFWGLEEQRSEN